MIPNDDVMSRDIHSCMEISILFSMFSPARVRPGEWAVLLLLAVSILWKGGKSLEITWLLAILISSLTIFQWIARGNRRRDGDRLLELKQGMSSHRAELPFGLWAVALFYLFWAILSYAFSETKNYGVDEIIRSASYMLLFLWIAREQIEGESEGMRQWFPVVVTTSAAVATAIGTAVYTLQPVNRFVGTFFDFRFSTDYWPNAWAQFLLLAWPMALLICWRQSDERRRWALFAVLSFILAGLFLSYSRGALLALIGQTVVMIILFGAVLLRDVRYRRMLQSIVRSVLVKTAVIVAVAMLLFFGANLLRSEFHEVQSVAEKVTFTAAEGTSSINERAQFWQQSSALAQQRPLLGWGPYSFRFVQPQYMQHVLATSDHAHNVLLKLSMERGYIAAFLFASIFGSVIGLAMLSFFTTRKATSPERDAFTVVTIGATTGMLLHNFIDFNLQFVGVSFTAIILLGLLVSPAAPVLTPGPISFRRWRIRKMLSRMEMALAVILLLLVLWEGVFLATSSMGRHAMAAGNNDIALQWFERSHPGLFSRDLYLSEAQIYIQKGRHAEALTALDRYRALNPHDPRGWKLRGEALLGMENNKEAIEALTLAYEKGRYTDIGITRLLLEAVQRAGKVEEYAPLKHEFDTIYSDFAQAIETNTHFIALSQNVEELQAVSRLLSEMYPLDAQNYEAIARSATEHAEKERQRFTARAQGMLW